MLQALSSTVGNDPTGYPYVFHDDPWLLPCEMHQRQEWTIAKVAGRKTARLAFLDNQ